MKSSASASSAFCVVVNPQSGSAGDDFAARVRAAFEAQGAHFELLETTPERGADVIIEEAMADGATLLVACGGDGTIMAAVNGLARATLDQDSGDDGDDEPNSSQAANSASPPVLCLVPGGTANLLATALGVPMDLEEAVEVAVHGRDRSIDLARVRGEYFALGLGLGLTERLVSRTSAREKEVIGKLAYVRAMLADLGARPMTFSFKLDAGASKRARGVALVVANSGAIGGKLEFAPRARMDDGLLDLCVLHRFWVRDVVRMLWAALRGTVESDPAVSFFQARRIEIRSNPPLDVQIDGEERDFQTPLTIEVVPNALTVRVPASDDSSAKLD